MLLSFITSQKTKDTRKKHKNTTNTSQVMITLLSIRAHIKDTGFPIRKAALL